MPGGTPFFNRLVRVCRHHQSGNKYPVDPAISPKLLVRILPYQPAHAEPLLAVFRKNVPDAFGPDEVAEYADSLRTDTDSYFTAEYGKRLVC